MARNERFSRLFSAESHYPRALFFLRFLFLDAAPRNSPGFVSIQIGRVIPRWHRFSWHFPKPVNTRLNGFFPPIRIRDSGLSFSRGAMKMKMGSCVHTILYYGNIDRMEENSYWIRFLNENIFWFIVSRGWKYRLFNREENCFEVIIIIFKILAEQYLFVATLHLIFTRWNKLFEQFIKAISISFKFSLLYRYYPSLKYLDLLFHRFRESTWIFTKIHTIDSKIYLLLRGYQLVTSPLNSLYIKIINKRSGVGVHFNSINPSTHNSTSLSIFADIFTWFIPPSSTVYTHTHILRFANLQTSRIYTWTKVWPLWSGSPS